MNLLARSDLKAAFRSAKQLLESQDNDDPSRPIDVVVPSVEAQVWILTEAVEKLCHVVQALDEEMEELRNKLERRNFVPRSLDEGCDD